MINCLLFVVFVCLLFVVCLFVSNIEGEIDKAKNTDSSLQGVSPEG